MEILKPGGISVHTTEFNVSSNDETASVGFNNILRRQDLEELDRQLRLIKCGLDGMDFYAGSHSFDLDFDSMPYFQGNGIHIKLQIEERIATSFLLVAQKA